MFFLIHVIWKGIFFYYFSKHLKKSYKINVGNFTKNFCVFPMPFLSVNVSSSRIWFSFSFSQDVIDIIPVSEKIFLMNFNPNREWMEYQKLMNIKYCNLDFWKRNHDAVIPDYSKYIKESSAVKFTIHLKLKTITLFW